MSDITVPNRGHKWLSSGDAAKAIGFGRNTIDRAMKLGAIPVRWSTGVPQIDLSDALLFKTKLLALASAERDAA